MSDNLLLLLWSAFILDGAVNVDLHFVFTVIIAVYIYVQQMKIDSSWELPCLSDIMLYSIFCIFYITE